MQNRIYKFQAWDTKRKKMWSAEEMGKDQLTLSPDGSGFINVSGALTKLSQYLTHLIPLQFTGLKDKKRTEKYPEGQEIYEGDIVEFDVINPIWDEEKHEVKEHRPETWRKVIEYKAPKFVIHWYPAKIEVIGNIYENPGLLEAKEYDFYYEVEK
jgi:uncharacterized phage protein (TIGR01671 family)